LFKNMCTEFKILNKNHEQFFLAYVVFQNAVGFQNVPKCCNFLMLLLATFVILLIENGEQCQISLCFLN
ncbi:hypothetical protein T4C_4668, partial [Trichinella pseudospiralis]